jgi:hypothetical protein
VYSASSTDHINLNRTNPLYLSRYRNSCWFRCRTLSPSSSFDEYNSSDLNGKISSLNSTTAYARLKRFTERLLELERKARETIIDNKCNQKISLKTNNTIGQADRLPSNVGQQSIKKSSFDLPIENSINTK